MTSRARLDELLERARRWRPSAPDGLQSRLLILTVLFTLAVEALILLPNAANFPLQTMFRASRTGGRPGLTV